MARKHEVDKINLQIDAVLPFVNDRFSGIIFEWSSDIGFGEYTIFKAPDSNVWYADSEHMDSNDDKDFVKELMRQFIEKLVVKE